MVSQKVRNVAFEQHESVSACMVAAAFCRMMATKAPSTMSEQTRPLFFRADPKNYVIYIIIHW
jgi:hypothetical protein